MNEQTLFAEALERTDPHERAAFLDSACLNDPALRQRIDRLLAQHEQAGSFLESPTSPPEPTIDQPGTERAGTTIANRYKLLEEIGEGGMGAVWMAQQSEPIKRRVAIKLIKQGMDSKQVLARFEAERQALALMDHPNIAKVFDAGTMGELSDSPGRPYFVMELVKGVPITKYCDEHHLTPRQRLELFIPVCHAIQHAHQKGIIHRDIKPSNVLVAMYDDHPVPKVIDFGVAKATGQQLTESTLHTNFGAVVGTLEYMSPEQASFNQLDVDTRSDIYSLGVLLYELLAGTPPFTKKDLEKAGVMEMLRVIREQEPSKPSTKLSSSEALPSLSANRGTEPSRLTKLLRGELDWIVMKALEKDRSRRYETANGFAMDVQRYLADEPVLACPPSAGYRLRKFARRNKGGLAVAGLILFFLVFLGGGIGWAVRDREAREAEATRQRGERQAKAGGQVESIFAEVDRLEDEQKWPEALAAARRAEAVVAGGEADAETAERVRARLKSLAFIDRLEQIRTERATQVDGKFDDVGADRKYARAFRDYGVDVDTLAVGASIDRLKARPALAIPLAAALDDWVEARRFGGGQDTAGWERLVAVACGLDPEPLRDRLRASWGQPVTPEGQADLRRLAASIDVRSHHPATLHQLALTLRRAQLPELEVEVLRRAQWRHRSDFWINVTLAWALSQMGPRHDDEALSFLRAALAVRPQSSAAHINLGYTLSRQKRLDETLVCFRTAIELDAKNALAHYNLGTALDAQGKLDEAIACYRRAIELDPKLAPAHHNLGGALTRQEKWDEAIARCRTAIELAPKDPRAHHNLGVVLFNQCELLDGYTRKVIDANPNLAATLPKLAEAATCFKKAIELDSEYAESYVVLGSALRYQGQLDEAIATLQKAIDLKPKDFQPWYLRGLVYRDLQQPDKARADFAKAIELQPDHEAARAKRHQTYPGQLDRAVADYTKDIERNPRSAIAWFYRGHAHADLKQYDQAQADYTKAIELKPDDVRLWSARGLNHSRLGQHEKAVADFSRAIQLRPNDRVLLSYRASGYRILKQWDKYIADKVKLAELMPDSEADLYVAWMLATCPDPKFRDGPRAVAFAKKAVERRPQAGVSWTYLGAAQYRAGDWKAAIAALDKSMELDKGGCTDWFFLAMAHWQLKDKPEARKWYDKAVEWMDKNPHDDEELRRFRAEASELLGVVERGRVEVAPLPHVKKK